MGKIICEFIAIDCSENEVENEQNYFHILTHIKRRYKSSVQKNLPSQSVSVYTSEFNVWYLETFFEINIKKFVGVPLNTETKINFKGQNFSFEFLDAHHVPGAVMILLKGDFGTYFYTGNCRFNKQMTDEKSLQPFLYENKLDNFYIDGTYYCEGFIFPSREETVKHAINLIDAHRDHTIYITASDLGHEEALWKIALALNEKIHVSLNKYKILHKLGWNSLFTTVASKSRIHVVEYKEVSRKKMKQRQELNGPCIAVVMSACNLLYGEELLADLQSNGIFVIPFSNHNSFHETLHMTSIIQAKKIVYLNKYDKIKKKIENNSEKKIVIVNLDSSPCIELTERIASLNETVSTKDVQVLHVLRKPSKTKNITNLKSKDFNFKKTLSYFKKISFDSHCKTLWDVYNSDFVEKCKNILKS